MKAKSLLVIAALVSAWPLVPTASAESPEGRHGRHWRHERFLASLTPDERQKLRAAHHKVKEDPAVQAAKERQRQATRELHDLKRTKMLEADPSLQPILDKLPTRRGRGF